MSWSHGRQGSGFSVQASASTPQLSCWREGGGGGACSPGGVQLSTLLFRVVHTGVIVVYFHFFSTLKTLTGEHHLVCFPGLACISAHVVTSPCCSPTSQRVQTRGSPCQRCKDMRVYDSQTTAIHDAVTSSSHAPDVI